MTEEKGKMESFDEWLPRSQEVVVGNKVMRVEELTSIKRDTIVKILFSKIDIVPLLQPFMDEAVKEHEKKKKTGEKADGTIKVNVADIAGKMKDILVDLLSKDMSTICCVILDTETNRKKLSEESTLTTPIPLDAHAEDQDHGYDYTPEMWELIKKTLTVRQEQNVIQSFVRVNDFVGLVKNYWSLVVSNVKAAREGVSLKNIQ